MSRFLCALIGLAFVACECWGVFDYLHEPEKGPTYTLAIGLLLAAVAPALPWASVKSWRSGLKPVALLAALVFPAAVALVLLAGISRLGSVADAADATVTQANRTYKLAEEAKTVARAALDAATATEAEECKGKGEKGPQCKTERANLATARAQYNLALAALRDAPVAQSNPTAHRVAELFPFISEAQVSLYVPMLWPLVAFLVGTVFLSVGLHAPKPPVLVEILHHSAPAATHPQVIEPTPVSPTITATATRPQLVPMRSAKAEADTFARAKLRPGSGRLPLGEIRASYKEWCANQGLEPLPDAQIAKALSAMFERVGLFRDGDAIVGLQLAS